MIEITYRYDPEHIRTYQALASRRVEAKDSDFASEWWSWMLAYTLVAGATLAAANLAFPVLTRRPFCALEFVCGFVGGLGVRLHVVLAPLIDAYHPRW